MEIGMLENKDPTTSLYVGNLHPECTEAMIFEKFWSVGQILSIRICRDIQTGSSLGYAYVNFTKPEEAKEAMDTLNYDQLNGQPVRIMWAQKDVRTKLLRAANLVVKNLDKSIDDKVLKDIFSSHGNILSVKIATYTTGDSKGYGFVQFENEKSADEAIMSINDSVVHGRKVAVSKFIPFEERKRFQELSFSNNVFVKNLTPSFTSGDLEQLCSSFGDINSVRVVTNEEKRSKGYGFISFENPASADRAIIEMNRMYLNGRRLFASKAKKKFSRSNGENAEEENSPEWQSYEF